MDIDAILKDMGSHYDETVDWLRDANIDQYYPDDYLADLGYATPIEPLVEDHLAKHLPEGYSMDVNTECPKEFQYYIVSLEKSLKSEKEIMKSDLTVVRSDSVKTVVAVLYRNTPFSSGEGRKPKDFRKIGDILDRIKLAYEQIEKYCDSSISL